MQDRWVSYIFRYKENIKCENTGYVKVVRTSRNAGDEVRIDIGLKLFKPMRCRCRAYLIYGGRELVFLDEVLIPPEERDTINMKKKLPWTDVIKEGYSLKDYDGLLFVVDDGDTLMSLWVDDDIKVEDLKYTQEVKEENVLPENAVGEDSVMTEVVNEPSKIELISIPEYLKDVENNVSQHEEFQAIDPIEQIMKTHIKLPQFIDSPFTECVKLVPQDIGRLPIGNWKLGQNSFLTHGYYRYKYIMLGKVRVNDKETYVIGVPGVFTNKEKYLANMFGFGLFIPVKKADIKTGSFGYWVWEVLRQ